MLFIAVVDNTAPDCAAQPKQLRVWWNALVFLTVKWGS